ncbi:MAG: hypothetical protein KDI04_04730, partial [Halieaceae bacterium]|nr:hypothetical protein [Halieaceae bacterium]
MTAIAFESLVKLAAMLVLLVAAVYGVFGGPGNLEVWLGQNPQVGDTLQESMRDSTARALLLI